MKLQLLKGHKQELNNASRPVNGKQPGLLVPREENPVPALPDRNWFAHDYSQIVVDHPTHVPVKLKAVPQVFKSESGYYSIEVVDDTEGFHALKQEWDELLKISPVNNLFLTWDWLLTWWRHLSEDRILHLIVIRRDREVIAIVPLCLRSSRLGYLLPYKMFEFLGVGDVGSDYADLIIRPGAEQLALQVLIKYLADRNFIIEFTKVLSTSSYMSDFNSLLDRQGWRVSVKTSHICPYINLTGLDWEGYLASLGHSHRYNFRRRLKNLRKDFADYRFEQVHTEEQMKLTLTRLIELHNLRWNERGGSDAFHRPGLLNFHADITHSSLHQDSLRLYVLRLNGKAAAILYGFKYNNVLYYYQSGFDTSLSRYSVGMVIMGLAIKSAIEEGIEKFDFLHGEEEYKYLWTSGQHELIRITCVPPGIFGATYSRVMALRKSLRRLIRNFLPGFVVAWVRSRK